METMGSSRNNAKKPIRVDKQELAPESSAVEENVQAIKRWESADLMKRTDLKRLTNRMEELAEPADASASTKSDAEAESPRAAAS
jgi:hypothetical protein